MLRQIGIDAPEAVPEIGLPELLKAHYDPASVAIIVGTVDMIGPRLLFEGYGVSRKMRPYHAGLLGADTLVVLDEAHLVPPFEKLLETVADSGQGFGAHAPALQALIPPFKLVSLSATGRTFTDKPFGLTAADLKHSVVKQRLDATKRLKVMLLEEDKRLTDALAEEAWKLAENGVAAVRIIVYCDNRKDAETVKETIERLAKGDKKAGIPALGRYSEHNHHYQTVDPLKPRSGPAVHTQFHHNHCYQTVDSLKLHGLPLRLEKGSTCRRRCRVAGFGPTTCWSGSCGRFGGGHGWSATFRMANRR